MSGGACRSGCLLRDRDWAPFDGRIYQIARFTPFAKVDGTTVMSFDRSSPYALIDLKDCEQNMGYPADLLGAVTHKDDFKRLWWAFEGRGLGADETAVVVWSKRNLKLLVRPFSLFMPRIAVTIFKADALKLLCDKAYRLELRGEARFLAELPLHHWQPEIWRDPIISTLYDEYVRTYMNSGDEKYLKLIEKYQ